MIKSGTLFYLSRCKNNIEVKNNSRNLYVPDCVLSFFSVVLYVNWRFLMYDAVNYLEANWV